MRSAATRPVPARDPPGAQPDHVAPRLAGHKRARPRRDLDVLVLLPRARGDPRPVRVLLRPADAHAILPGWRRLRRPAAWLRREAAAFLAAMPDGSTSTTTCCAATRSCSSACAESAARRADAARARRHRAAAARRRQPLGPAQGDPYSSYDDFDFKIPVGTVGDNYDRFAVRLAEIYESVKIISQALEGLPEGPSSPPTARSRCRRDTSSRPRWRR